MSAKIRNNHDIGLVFFLFSLAFPKSRDMCLCFICVYITTCLGCVHFHTLVPRNSTSSFRRSRRTTFGSLGNFLGHFTLSVTVCSNTSYILSLLSVRKNISASLIIILYRIWIFNAFFDRPGRGKISPCYRGQLICPRQNVCRAVRRCFKVDRQRREKPGISRQLRQSWTSAKKCQILNKGTERSPVLLQAMYSTKEKEGLFVSFVCFNTVFNSTCIIKRS